MTTSAPLKLLVPSGLSETAAMLRNAAASGEGMAITSGAPDHESCMISCRGMQLKLSIAEHCDIRGFKNIFCNVDEKLIGSVISIQLGSHLESGETVPAVVKGMLTAAVEIGQITAAFAVMWLPANTLSGFDYFARVVAEYNHDGIFPVLALVNFKKASDGFIHSTGLNWLAGQELVVSPSHLSDSELMRRILRVAHDLAVGGSMTSEHELVGLESDEYIILTPQSAVRTLNMQTASISLQ